LPLALSLVLPLGGVGGVFARLPAGFRRVSPHDTPITPLPGKNAGTSLSSVTLPW
jgi:hypothetical protein